MSFYQKHLWIILASYLVFLPLKSWCEQPSVQDLPGHYPAIDDRIIHRFVETGLVYAESLYGEPTVEPKNIQLRYSVPLKNGKDLQTNFQRCDLTNRANGLFTIYLSRMPKEYAFDGQLAHEIAHLLNAQMFDCYVEGLNTVFAEKLLKKMGKDWSGWLLYFQEGGDPFYASTYFMMKDISDVADSKDIKSLLQHAVYSDETKTKMHIDIDSWLNSLPTSKKHQIKTIIMKHAPKIQQAMMNAPYKNIFELPRN